MGLDQYLRASEYVSRGDYFEDENGDYKLRESELFKQVVEQFEATNAIDTNGFAGISVELPMGYWRKANQIHRWFVDNVQDGEDNCGSYYVSRDDLEELRSACLEVITDPDKAMDLLPPQEGFFFGGYEVDEWYFQQLLDTVDILNRCLSSKFSSFEYQSSW